MTFYTAFKNVAAVSGQLPEDKSVWGTGPYTTDLVEDMKKCQETCDKMSDCGGYTRSVAYSKNHCNFFRMSAKLGDAKPGYGYTTYIKNGTSATRKDIDEKIAAIYEVPGTETANYKERYEQTMNMGILWAAVGTVVLFYTFKSMS